VQIGDGRVIADARSMTAVAYHLLLPGASMRQRISERCSACFDAARGQAAPVDWRQSAGGVRLAERALRTLLAMLGLVIGVGAVITLLAVGRGSQDDVQRNIQSLGTNLLTVRAGAPSQAGVRQAAGSRPTLTYEDAQAILAPGAVEHVASLTVEQNVPCSWSSPAAATSRRRRSARRPHPSLQHALASGEFFPASVLGAVVVARTSRRSCSATEPGQPCA
jgi:hypothetical protein